MSEALAMAAWWLDDARLVIESRERAYRLHGFSLSWLDGDAGTGHDSVRANTRRETVGCWSTSR
jgi:hypothetical protein